jgi:UDP-N-acetylmuramyl tripeptide synthase
VTLAVAGRHNVYNAAAAAAAARAGGAGGGNQTAADLHGGHGRMELVDPSSSAVLIEDTYVTLSVSGLTALDEMGKRRTSYPRRHAGTRRRGGRVAPAIGRGGAALRLLSCSADGR